MRNIILSKRKFHFNDFSDRGVHPSEGEGQNDCSAARRNIQKGGTQKTKLWTSKKSLKK